MNIESNLLLFDIGVIVAEFFPEFLDSSFGIDNFLLAGIKRVTGRADINLGQRLCALGVDDISTDAIDRNVIVFRMNIFFHIDLLL